MGDPLPAQTTEQEDLTHAGQRRVNLIWEVTQASIAIAIVLANIAAAIVILMKNGRDDQFPFVLSSSMFLVIGFYFSRTNHQAIGGVGVKPVQSPYTGR